MNFINKLTEKQKRKYEIIFAIVLLFVMFEMRAYKLDADPPTDMSFSSDVYTDPSQYTLFAKQKILTGDINPYNENRFVFFLKSSVTLLALLVFKLFGVSYEMANLVGLFYSFGALLLFYLILRKATNRITAFIYLLMIAINYNQIFFGRLPFLEHAMTFYAFLSLTLLLYCKRVGWIVFAGASLAIGIFFGKVIGVVFLAPFVGYFFYQYFVEEKKNLKEIMYYTAGFGSVLIFWLFYSYLPMQSQVTSYVGEQAISLYGAPEAFESFDRFLWKYLSFGNESNLFIRMIIPWSLATLFVTLFTIRLFIKGSLKEKLKEYNSGQFFIILMMISFYGSLMIWNYRPLRYQIVLIYVVYAAASIILASCFKNWKKPEKINSSLICIPIIFLTFFPLVYQFYSKYVVELEGALFYDDNKLIITAWAGLISIIIYGAYVLFQKYQHLANKYIRYAIPVLIMMIIYMSDFDNYLNWTKRPTFTAHDNSLDVGQILSSNAVVSGPYAGLLTSENKIGTIIHMFGVSQADLDLFKKRPITHLLLDKSNESRAKEDYPILMDSSKLIMTYHIGLKKVRLYRIAGFTGNSTADNYQLSQYEQLVADYDDGNGKINNDLAVEIISKYSDNIACYTFLAEAAERDSIYQLSEMMFKKAVEFSPTNYNLNARLAKYYQDRYNETKSELYKAESKNYYEEAIKFAPTASSLKKKLEELNNS